MLFKLTSSLAVVLLWTATGRAEGVEKMPIACRMNALSPVERARSQQLRAELVRGVVQVEERDDGYAFLLRDEAKLLTDLVEWIRLERRCCPFLAFEVRWPQGGEAPPWMILRGPEGTKAFLREELPELPGR